MNEDVHLISEDELCLDLINSEHFDYRGRADWQDNLENPEWMAAFVQRWQLPVASTPDTMALTLLQTLRALLRSMVESLVAQQPLTEGHIEELNTFLGLTPVMYQARREGDGVGLQTVMLRSGWIAAVTLIAVSWVELLARTPASRLKVCANPACHWVFVDQSHNMSRRWCRQWACGNLMKVRQFRAQRSGEGQ